MSEHNTNFYSLENIKETLKSCEDFLDGEEVYYHIGALRFAYDEIERLNNIICDLEYELETEIKIGKETFPDDKFVDIVCETLKQVLISLKELKEGK